MGTESKGRFTLVSLRPQAKFQTLKESEKTVLGHRLERAGTLSPLVSCLLAVEVCQGHIHAVMVFGFGGITPRGALPPSACAQGFLLQVLRGLYGILGIEDTSALGKTSILAPILSDYLGPRN